MPRASMMISPIDFLHSDKVNVMLLKNRALEGSWGGLLGLLGCLEQSWRVLARLGRIWGAIWVRLGASEGVWEEALEPFWTSWEGLGRS